jgi:serine/threonine protein kinase/serine/threonine protein phosphatase PrpC
MSSELKVSLGQASSRGVKERNEDFHGAMIPRGEALETKGVVCAIADGMGSCEYAAEASEECVKAFLSDYYSTPDSWSVKQSGGKVLTAINNWLLSQGQSETARGMVTTFDALVLKSTTAHLFHVGDARVYRLRGDDFECLTRDHRVNVSREQSYLSRAMGIDSILDIDYRTVSLRQDDLFLMSTDGVHDYLSPERLRALLRQDVASLDELAAAIVDEALDNGSHDNVTAQVVRIDGLPSQDANEVIERLTRLPFPPHLGPGMTMDGFEILEEIHASTTSQLYRVRDVESGEELVMKTPSVNFEDDPAYIERFTMEEWVGKRIHSPLVVRIHESQRPRSFLYYVMERVEGITLRRWMEQNPDPDIDEVVELVEKIIAGVRVFHRLEMLHRDLKPENIIITPNQGIKIIDFGSVKIGGLQEISTPIERIDLLGTKNYTAPEYLLGSSGDTRSDLFSVGVMAYEMLTGHLPYGDRLTRQLNWKTLSKIRYQSAIRHNPMLPLWMDGALEKAVRLDIKQRYGHFSEFLFDLKNPNPLFMNRSAPLIEKDPSLVWKTIAGLSLIGNLALLYLLSR